MMPFNGANNNAGDEVPPAPDSPNDGDPEPEVELADTDSSSTINGSVQQDEPSSSAQGQDEPVTSSPMQLVAEGSLQSSSSSHRVADFSSSSTSVLTLSYSSSSCQDESSMNLLPEEALEELEMGEPLIEFPDEQPQEMVDETSSRAQTNFSSITIQLGERNLAVAGSSSLQIQDAGISSSMLSSSSTTLTEDIEDLSTENLVVEPLPLRRQAIRRPPNPEDEEEEEGVGESAGSPPPSKTMRRS